MITKIQYTDQASRQAALDANTDKFLTEEANITEGNFLTFTDVKPMESQIQDLSNTANMILLKQEGII